MVGRAGRWGNRERLVKGYRLSGEKKEKCSSWLCPSCWGPWTALRRLWSWPGAQEGVGRLSPAICPALLQGEGFLVTAAQLSCTPRTRQPAERAENHNSHIWPKARQTTERLSTRGTVTGSDLDLSRVQQTETFPSMFLAKVEGNQKSPPSL